MGICLWSVYAVGIFVDLEGGLEKRRDLVEGVIKITMVYFELQHLGIHLLGDFVNSPASVFWSLSDVKILDTSQLKCYN